MSDNPADGRVGALLARLQGLHPLLIDLSTERLLRVLAALGDPQERLPPVLHVAGTNGKGSACAFARSVFEAAGLRTHVFTSPHLVRFHERFRVAGALVSDDVLADAVARVLAANDGAPLTVFEAVTAVAFDLFARTPADACVLEVGLGGRGDATNVVTPRACAITSVSLDHTELLGATVAAIAGEKAGIIKPGVPVATGRQMPEALAVLRDVAGARGARLLVRDADFAIEAAGDGVRYEDSRGVLALPALGLAGAHQLDNAGVAIAALRAGWALDPAAFAGVARAAWPGRLQRLHGRLAAMVPGRALWVDGAHNVDAAERLAAHVAGWAGPVHLVVGMKRTKDSAGFLAPLLPLAGGVFAVAEPAQHLATPVAEIVAASGGRAVPGPDLAGALAQVPVGPGTVLICGSLYLAGVALGRDGVVVN